MVQALISTGMMAEFRTFSLAYRSRSARLVEAKCCWVIIDISPNRDVAQTCALPPSTNSSIPVTKLESSDARYSAALATSSGFPMRPIGMVDTIRAITSADCRLASGVSIGPGLTTFERIRRSFRSVVQVRAKDRIAALLAAETPKAAVPLMLAADAVRM